jgi:hypothetical protein
MRSRGVGYLGLEVLVDGDGVARNVQTLLDRLDKRGGEYRVEIGVFYSRKCGGFTEEGEACRRWVSVKGALSGKAGVEYWM